MSKQEQETTNKAKENAILSCLCEDIIEKVNKMIEFKIPTRIYTLYFGEIMNLGFYSVQIIFLNPYSVTFWPN